MNKRVEWFICGMLLALILLLYVFAYLGCQSSTAAAGAKWVLINPGVYIVETPTCVVMIEVRCNTPRDTYWWRIIVVPKRLLEKPPGENREEA